MLESPHHSESFHSSEALAIALARCVAAELQSGVHERGSASIALSGGSTPARFFAVLFSAEVNWSSVTLTLVDDRCVPHDSTRSNIQLLNTARQGTPAMKARLMPLTNRETGAPLLDVSFPQRFDVVVLGMGTDGHTASLFPDGDQLREALADDAPPLLAISAPGAPEPRVTMSLRRINATRSCFLHVEGKPKHETLRRALRTGPTEAMPIRAFLRQSSPQIHLYTTPQLEESP